MSSAWEAGPDSVDAWWAALSPETRLQVIESVRLDEDPADYAVARPTAEQADFVRRQPEYLERFAGADAIARADDAGFGLDPVPNAHADTVPLAESDAPEPVGFRRDV